jgi:hypothetical protein
MTKTCGLFLLDVLLLYGAWLRGPVPREDSHMWVAYGGIIFPPKNRTMFLVELSHQSCNRREALIGVFSRGPQYENARDEMFYLF